MKNTGAYILFAAVALLWLVTPVFLPQVFSGPVTVIEFGGMFGAVNAFFSGLALAALLLTLWLQKQEMSAQSAIQSDQTELLKKSARMNALSALLARYTQQAGNSLGSTSGQEQMRIAAIRKELESYLN